MLAGLKTRGSLHDLFYWDQESHNCASEARELELASFKPVPSANFFKHSDTIQTDRTIDLNHRLLGSLYRKVSR